MSYGIRVKRFTERSADMPAFLRRHSALIRDLDEKAVALQQEAAQAVQQQLAEASTPRAQRTSGGSGAAAKRQKAAAAAAQQDGLAPAASGGHLAVYDVDGALQRLVSLAEEKVAIASQMYDYIDQHIQSLDNDLRALENEIGADRDRLGLKEEETACARLGMQLPRAPKRKAAIAATAAIADASGSASMGLAGADSACVGAWGPGSTDNACAGAHLPKKQQLQQQQQQHKRLHQKKQQKITSYTTTPLLDEPGPSTFEDLPPEALAGPLYCVCQRPSYGEMVGCDNPDCTLEWFHLGCLGLSTAPEGHWLCPQCSAAAAGSTAPAPPTVGPPALPLALPPAAPAATRAAGVATARRGGRTR